MSNIATDRPDLIEKARKMILEEPEVADKIFNDWIDGLGRDELAEMVASSYTDDREAFAIFLAQELDVREEN